MNVPRLLRRLVEDFLEEFSLAETQLLAAKTQRAVLLIKELFAAAKVMRFPLQAEKGGAGGGFRRRSASAGVRSFTG